MNSNANEQSGKMLGRIAWLLVVILTIIAMYTSSYLELAVSIRAIIWLAWFITSLFLFYCTEQGKEVYSFAKKSKIEMQKVVWPSRSETVQTTMIVIAMVAVTGFVLWAIDMSMMWVIGKITHLG